ncbi:hypothetical protein MKW94_002484 [Papaver nudicaule]|uniref:Uncharacterized protein n=1 Tax=Papaver nudicaule TaxID=74823 RepID=A0AA41UVE3_PAPNU|nr:hypothetical protein [Papaver nudicaule]
MSSWFLDGCRRWEYGTGSDIAFDAFRRLFLLRYYERHLHCCGYVELAGCYQDGSHDTIARFT